jgi:hypothetical protein
MEIVNNSDGVVKNATNQAENDKQTADTQTAQTAILDPTSSSRANNPHDSDSESDNYFNDFNIKRFSNKTDH